MISRGQAITRHASPAVWGLVAIAGTGLAYVAIWNVLEYRKQLREFAGH